MIEGSPINVSHQLQLSATALRLDDEVIVVIRGSPGDLVGGALIGTYGQSRRSRSGDDLKKPLRSKPLTRYRSLLEFCLGVASFAS